LPMFLNLFQPKNNLLGCISAMFAGMAYITGFYFLELNVYNWCASASSYGYISSYNNLILYEFTFVAYWNVKLWHITAVFYYWSNAISFDNTGGTYLLTAFLVSFIRLLQKELIWVKVTGVITFFQANLFKKRHNHLKKST
jgi:hypothetical protein